MSWHFSRELGAAFSARIFSGQESSEPSNSTLTQDKSSSNDKENSVINSLSGATAVLSMDLIFGTWWKSLVRASRASRSRKRASGLRRKTSATDGLTPSGLFARYDQQSACWKTCQDSSVSRTDTSGECSAIFTKQGSMRNGHVYQQPPLGPAIAANDCGCLPTPCATEPAKSLLNWRDKLNKPRSERGGGCGPNLATAVMMWPTPSTRDRMADAESRRGGPSLGVVVRMLPTPTATSYGSNSGGENLGPARPSLQTMAKQQHGEQLNPDWVEWFMFWPVGWTRLGRMNPQTFREWLQVFETALRDCAR